MRYVIIGNSAAGIGAVEGIRQIDKQGEITVISSEPHYTYSRPLISYLLLGKTTEEKMRYRGGSFYIDNNVSFVHSDVTAIDAKAKQVRLADSANVPYDKLLVATGSSAFVPPFEGLDTVKDKFTFMSLDDAKRINEQLAVGGGQGTGSEAGKRVLIIGAGLIGLKCAEGIAKRAASITVIDLAPRILSSILDDDGAKIVQQHIENAAGVEFKLGCSVKKFEENAARLDNGETVSFDVLVLAVGVRPNTALLKSIADIDRGIIVDSRSAVSVCDGTSQDIYAAGDCTQTTDVSSGQNKIMALLPNAYMQGECAGINMAGGEKSFDKAVPMNAIGFFGLHTITAGNYTGEVFTTGNPQPPLKYKKLFYSDNKLNGYIMIGDVEKAGIYTSLIRERTPLDSLDFALVCERPGLMAFTKEERMAKLGRQAS